MYISGNQVGHFDEKTTVREKNQASVQFHKVPAVDSSRSHIRAQPARFGSRYDDDPRLEGLYSNLLR
jgi:hypothetical protein